MARDRTCAPALGGGALIPELQLSAVQLGVQNFHALCVKALRRGSGVGRQLHPALEGQGRGIKKGKERS